MELKIDTSKIADEVISKALKIKIDGKTFRQWIEEIKKRRWISVHERLPSHFDRVPVLYRFTDKELNDGELHTSMLWYVHEPFCNDDSPHWEKIGNYEYEVLYWFELPEPPKEEPQCQQPTL